MCESERPVIGLDERIVFTRTIASIPEIYAPEQKEALSAGRTLHELGPVSNLCADWGIPLSEGLLARREVALATRQRWASEPESVESLESLEFLDAAVETIDAVLELAIRYADAAAAQGRDDIATVLRRVPALPAQSFHEALQSLRLLHAVVWLGGNYHVGFGRFDQYMQPYLERDLQSGRLTHAEAGSLLAEFFISLNRDSDLYPGVQQGDNGQSLMLGGVKRDGSNAVNELTWMVLRVARDVAMIDPKINLRIDRDTDLGLLKLAAELTRIGLGFPQYSNDDVVIPALVAHGYDIEDARNYTVAACWEFIIPGKGTDIVNCGAVSFPAAVDHGIRLGLAALDDWSGLLNRVGENIAGQVGSIVARYRKLLLPPAPYYSLFMDGCLESGRDLSKGLKYRNLGIHGAASVSAADALAAVAKFVYREKTVRPKTLLQALDANFEGYESLRRTLAEEGPKTGNNDQAADEMLIELFDRFAEACESVHGLDRSDIVRPGTGSAMYYLWLAAGHAGMREPCVGATADGRRAGDYFSANLAPSPGVRINGPFSVLQTFSKLNYRRICNGGPITMELSDSVFRSQEAIDKVAMLVHVFAALGCQQLQLNTVNVATLRDAQKHPEQHKNLVVRIWGWSGYFCELDLPFQEHIIARHSFEVSDEPARMVAVHGPHEEASPASPQCPASPAHTRSNNKSSRSSDSV
jgi:formate C-acetyltransferase